MVVIPQRARRRGLAVATTLTGLMVVMVARNPLPRSRQQALASEPAGLSSRDVAVVINSADPLSEQIGRTYQSLRGIPPEQLVRIRFPPGQGSLSPAAFRQLRGQILRQTPGHVQIYALAWAAPWRVGCQSITSALTLGLDPTWCARGCRLTRQSPYYARGDVRRPYDSLGLRPSMLLAARDGREARRLIARGVAADGTAPPGSAYLMSTSDPSRNSRATGFADVARMIGPSLTVRVLRADRLEGADDVIALFTGLARVEGLTSNRFRPGAVADHLTSFGGELTAGPTQGNQMSALRWLEAGATGSYGTVVEPCNFPTKFPNPLLVLTYYRRGDSMVEAYWRSVAMPGQGVFIGEPLARPWGRVSRANPGGGSGARPRHAQGLWPDRDSEAASPAR